MMKKILKQTILLSTCAILSLCVSGCTSGKFESIMPPTQDYPTSQEYEMTEAFEGYLVVERFFFGNKEGNTLYIMSDSGTVSGFELGDKGIVTYNKLDETVMVQGVLTQIPEDGKSGKFVVEHEDASSVKDKFPGKFSVIVGEYPNCLMVEKSAVLVLDEEGNAIVHKVDDKGLLYDVNITVGAKNSEYYQVLSGLEAVESVVMR